MTITVVGCGSIGMRHIRNLIALGITAGDIRAVDARQDVVEASELGVSATWCNGEITTRDIGTPDALLICTPADQHEHLIEYAQHRRIPFFVEKPATLSTDVSFNWATDVPHLVACNLRFRSELIAMHAHAANATSGEFVCLQDMRQWPGRDYAEPLFEFCHEIDLALWMFGPAILADATRAHRTYRLTLQHESGATSSVTVGDATGEPIRSWNVGGAITSFVGTLPRLSHMYVKEMAHFLRVVRGEEPSCNTLAHARHVVEICERAEAIMREVA